MNSGVLLKEASPAERKEVRAIDEVENFDGLVLPILSYWAYAFEKEIEEDAEINYQTFMKILDNMLVTMHNLNGVTRKDAKNLALVVRTSGKMHFLKNRALEKYIAQLELLCKKDV